MKQFINELINVLWIPSLTRKQWAIGVGFFTFLLLTFGAATNERWGLTVIFLLLLAIDVWLARKEDWTIDNETKIV